MKKLRCINDSNYGADGRLIGICIEDGHYEMTVRFDGENESRKFIYDSLYALYSDWVDCKEPLIKDEKIRKAVSVWAEANNFSVFTVYNSHFNTCKILGRKDRYDPNGSSIEFLGTIADVKKITYDIDQLCGEDR